VKLGINSIVVHPQLKHKEHLMDDEFVGVGLVNFQPSTLNPKIMSI
jgi:hypothetical protein